MGAVESTNESSNAATDGKATRRRYCGNFLGGDADAPTGDVVVKSHRSPSVTSRTITAAPGTSPNNEGSVIGSPDTANGYLSASPMSSPSLNGRTLTINVPGKKASPSQSPTQEPRELTLNSRDPLQSERDRQEKELEAERAAKKALRKSQQLDKKLIKQIKKQAEREERARIKEEIAIAQAEAEAKALLAQTQYELQSWSVACDKFRADRRSRSLMALPPTLDAALKYLASKENKRKLIILSIQSLERCETDLAAAQVIDHDDAAKLSMSPGTATRALPKGKSDAKDSKTATATAVADAKGELALKDHFAFKFTIRNPSNGVESVGEAWAIVYKTVKADATPDRDGVRPCVVGECIGGWTKK